MSVKQSSSPTTGVAHLTQRTLLGVSGGLWQQKTHGLAEAYSDHWIRVLH